MNFSTMFVFVNIEFFSGQLMPAHLSYENFGNLASKNCDHFDIFQSMKNSNRGWKNISHKRVGLIESNQQSRDLGKKEFYVKVKKLGYKFRHFRPV